MNRITEHNPFIFSKHINRSTVNNILNLLILLAFIILLCKISMSINYDFQSDFQSICCSVTLIFCYTKFLIILSSGNLSSGNLSSGNLSSDSSFTIK